MVADQVLCEAQLPGHLAVADLAAHQQQEDPPAGRIGEQPRKLGGRVGEVGSNEASRRGDLSGPSLLLDLFDRRRKREYVASNLSLRWRMRARS
jgi:hypothetical protein